MALMWLCLWLWVLLVLSLLSAHVVRFIGLCIPDFLWAFHSDYVVGKAINHWDTHLLHGSNTEKKIGFWGIFSVHVWNFSGRGAGIIFQTCWGTILLEFEHFLGRLPLSRKLQQNRSLDQSPNILWGFLCFGLDIFQGKEGRMTKIQALWGTLVYLK